MELFIYCKAFFSFDIVPVKSFAVTGNGNVAFEVTAKDIAQFFY